MAHEFSEKIRSRVKRIPYYLGHPLYVIDRIFAAALETEEQRRARNDGERLVIRSEIISERGKDFCTLAHVQRYIWAARFVRGLTCLDDGCGSGYGSYYLAKDAEAKKVDGVDLSKDAIGYARRHYRHFALEFHQMNSLELRFPDETFDVVLSFDVLEHISEQGQDIFVKETRRVLKKDGLFLLGCPNKALTGGGNPFHLRELLASEFLELLRRHYADVQLLGQDIVRKGERALADWHRYATDLKPSDLIITDDRVELCFGLLSLCRGLK
jgi:2-polyprenyl-3-methyl-5-hydroxy-6-metoxy-1,4-benzoquinol methylase